MKSIVIEMVSYLTVKDIFILLVEVCILIALIYLLVKYRKWLNKSDKNRQMNLYESIKDWRNHNDTE